MFGDDVASLVNASESVMFTHRAAAIPGDCRTVWRVALVLIALHHSRAGSSSYVRLHMLDGALRYPDSREILDRAIDGDIGVESSRLVTIDPGVTRAVAIAAGDGYVSIERVTGGSRIKLTADGKTLAHEIIHAGEALTDEIEYLRRLGKRFTELSATAIVEACNGA